MKKRYLTKSRYKLATECPTKLFYSGKTAYANQSMNDSFLLALADGGFQVGELAKCYFPGGHDITTLDYDEALSQTNKLLENENVIIFEAAIATDNLFIRVDVLVKSGQKIKFYEVKAKSFDRTEQAPFYNKNGSISSDWRPYLLDTAFQKHVIKSAFPSYRISAYLMMADKSVVCPTDGLNQKFRIIKDQNGRRSVTISGKLDEADLTPPILCQVNVDLECQTLEGSEVDTQGGGLRFAEEIKMFAAHYAEDEKISSPIKKECASCEFKTSKNGANSHLLSGKKECWQQQLGWRDKDFESQTVLDVWSFRRKDKLIAEGCIKMEDLHEEDINPKPDERPGLSPSERQWLQIDKYKNKDDSIWLDRENLIDEINSWEFPLHFIDFETSMAAIPFHAGRKPYEGIAFQFSHHTLDEDGTVTHAGEYLSTERGTFPNYKFIRALKAQLEHDNGTIFRYSNHENTFLNTIYRQIQSDQEMVPDAEELCAFIKTITQSVRHSTEQWIGDRNMVDMWDIVKRHYYDPRTKGSNSIKQVLPAILNSSKALQEKYSKPIYGKNDGIKSVNFEDWTWVEINNGEVTDPYKLLPKMFEDVSDIDMEILSHDTELADGGAALTAYARLQFEEMSDYERKEIEKALLKYCELDTMAMVMIYEGWQDLLRTQ